MRTGLYPDSIPIKFLETSRGAHTSGIIKSDQS
jgi:hypothetical protein